jgi:hypothetical protein
MDDPYWTHDTTLFDGAFRYYRGGKRPVRGKVHVSDERYDFRESGHGLERDLLTVASGKRIYVLMHPYVIEPDVLITVALSARPKRAADAPEKIGHVINSRVEGYRDVKVGSAQAWYYPEDKVIVLWECFLDSLVRDMPLLKDENMPRLWTGFERWLTERFPQAERIATPWMDPIWEPKEYQKYLRTQGYKRSVPGLFIKQLG